jgi:hypothetical protein
LKEAVVLLSSPKGVAVSTPDRVSVGAGKDVNVTTGSSFSVSALKSIVMAAESALSLFAHTLGIKMFAARGKIRIQAQSDELDISALKDITITSTDGKLVLSAKKEVWIGAGGSYLRITGRLHRKSSVLAERSPGLAIEEGISALHDRSAGYGRSRFTVLRLTTLRRTRPADHYYTLQA